MEFRTIDRDREQLVDFYVSDAARGVENAGLRFDEQEALRLVAKYERSQDRELSGDGAIRAASRMLDNVYDADDGAYDLARFMASDLAFQRHAAGVIAAADRFAADGTMPPEGTYDRVFVEYVIPDIVEDPDARRDWTAMAEGRFHDVSSMSEEIVERGVKDFENLPESDRSWFYDNERDPEALYETPKERPMDALQMAEVGEMQDREAMSAPEAAAALAEGLKEQGYEVAETSDRTDFTKLVLVREGGFGEADVQAVRDYADNFQFDTSDIRITREGDLTVDVTGASEYPPRQPEYVPTYNDVQEWLAGEPARHEWTDEEHAARVGGYLGSFRHERMMEEERDPTALVLSVSELVREQPADRPVPAVIVEGADRLAVMIDAVDPRKGDLARSVAEAVMGHVGLGAGVAEYWSMMQGSVKPLPEMLATIATDDRNAAAVDAVERGIPRDASGYEAFDALRMDVATGPHEDDYQPFRVPTQAALIDAERELDHVRDAIRFKDPTIVTDPGLHRAVLLLEDAGIPLTTMSMAATERAFVRAGDIEALKEPMSPNEKGRMIAYDVATQEEARGLLMGASGRPTDAARGMAISRPAEALVTRMGIRTLTQEGLDDADLKRISKGDFHEVSTYHRAGLHLGSTWAKEGLKGHEVIDERMDRLVYGSTMDVFADRRGKGLESLSSGGVVGAAQDANDFAAALSRGIAGQAALLDSSAPSKAKGARGTDDVLNHGMRNVREGGRG